MHFFTLDLSTSRILTFKTFDSILCLNVLEHIADDHLLLLRFSTMLKKNGKLILIVPAGQWLYSSLDQANGHYRRYSKETLARTLTKNNFRIKKMYYINALGIPYWFFVSKLLHWKTPRKGFLKIVDYFVPLSFWIDRCISHKIGLSLVCIAERLK